MLLQLKAEQKAIFSKIIKGSKSNLLTFTASMSLLGQVLPKAIQMTNKKLRSQMKIYPNRKPLRNPWKAHVCSKIKLSGKNQKIERTFWEIRVIRSLRRRMWWSLSVPRITGKKANTRKHTWTSTSWRLSMRIQWPTRIRKFHSKMQVGQACST